MQTQSLSEKANRGTSYQPAQARGGRLIIVVGGIPHSRRGAGSVIFHGYGQEGLKQAGFDILAVLLLSPANSEEDLAAYRAGMEGPAFRIITCRSPHFWRTTRVGHFFDHQAVARLRSEVEGFQPDYTFCLDFASAWAVEGWRLGRRTAWLGDLNFQTFWYHAVYARGRGYQRSWWPPAWSMARIFVEAPVCQGIKAFCECHRIGQILRKGIGENRHIRHLYSISLASRS